MKLILSGYVYYGWRAAVGHLVYGRLKPVWRLRINIFFVDYNKGHSYNIILFISYKLYDLYNIKRLN